MSKTIKVSDSVHYQLNLKGNKNNTYNDIIQRLIDESNEEFTDEEAREFNKRIEKFEKGDYSDTIKLDIDEELKKIGWSYDLLIYEHKEATELRKKHQSDKKNY